MNSGGERVQAPGVEITLEELRRRLKEGSLVIVNVLPPPAFEESRIPGSINLPLAEIPTRAGKVLPDKTREIVVYCANPT